MTGARIYGPWGHCVWPNGGTPLVDAELLSLPPAMLIYDTARTCDGSADLTVILGAGAKLPAGALGHIVAALDRGQAVAVHGGNAGTFAAIVAVAGGGHA